MCGMTRAVRLLSRGNFSRAAEYNPPSPLLAIFGILMVARLAAGRFTGRWVHFHVHRSAAARIVLIGLVAALWINQQANATLLMRA